MRCPEGVPVSGAAATAFAASGLIEVQELLLKGRKRTGHGTFFYFVGL